MSIAFVAPPSTSTVCSSTNLALKALEGSISKGCQNLPKSSKQSFTLLNPNQQSVSVILTDGSGSRNCDYKWDSSTVTYYKKALASTDTSISFSDVPCESSPCCALISCGDTRPCIGLSLTQNFTSPGTLAAGVIAAIVIGVLAVVALAAFLRWRKVRKDQQMAMAMAGAGAPAVVQIQMNPVVPYGSAPPMAPYGGAPPPGQPMPPGHQPQQPSYVWT